MVLISCSSYTLLEWLTNWPPEIDCERVLSITCHEKYSKLFSTLKCQMYCRSLLVEVVEEYFDEPKLSLLGPCWHHSNYRELLSHVVGANLCSWPTVKRKLNVSYNFIAFLCVTIEKIC